MYRLVSVLGLKPLQNARNSNPANTVLIIYLPVQYFKAKNLVEIVWPPFKTFYQSFLR
jgi:hypothetical protein